MICLGPLPGGSELYGRVAVICLQSRRAAVIVWEGGSELYGRSVAGARRQLRLYQYEYSTAVPGSAVASKGQLQYDT